MGDRGGGAPRRGQPAADGNDRGRRRGSAGGGALRGGAPGASGSPGGGRRWIVGQEEVLPCPFPRRLPSARRSTCRGHVEVRKRKFSTGAKQSTRGGASPPRDPIGSSIPTRGTEEPGTGCEKDSAGVEGRAQTIRPVSEENPTTRSGVDDRLLPKTWPRVAYSLTYSLSSRSRIRVPASRWTG